ncbi:DUF6338 family protein [Pseudomonas fragi]|uniref:DUF6338 family protein n=1 Tax=Pseudomonas fragi TaxID=296 RepID=UPI000BA1C440|nr:DUF6338 family protein [Pseudomonas fragi]PAA01270.1 hypothetical protein CJU76_18205 [Pseudomonas fragi]
MEGLSAEIIPVLQQLMPGFLAMIIFYWLAEAPKPTQFERVLQALISTAVIQLLVMGVEKAAYYLGNYYSFGEWSEVSTNVSAIFLAVSIGLALAHLCNSDAIFSVARKMGFTTKASQDDGVHIHKIFSNSGMILHFTDGKRLMGYLDVFPNNKQSGVYLVSNPIWITADVRQECPETNTIMISGTDVQWVEFLK